MIHYIENQVVGNGNKPVQGVVDDFLFVGGCVRRKQLLNFTNYDTNLIK